MKKQILLFLTCCLLSPACCAQSFTKQQYREDLHYFWQTIADNYCYFEKKKVDWNSLKPIYEAQIDTVNNRAGFVAILERALYELYDHHIGLRTNNPYSRRLVPTSTDIWATYQNGRPLITEVRKRFGAEKAGVRAGMEVIAINGIEVSDAIKPFLAHTVNNESKSFALRLALAGDHITARKLTLKSGNKLLEIYPDSDGMQLEKINYPSLIEAKRMADGIGYLKINNYLYDDKLIGEFDNTLNQMLDTKALIIDMRETPSGGNTVVARAILGRFINREHFYQKHELYAEEKSTGVKRSWIEIVSPRGRTYTSPVVVLVDHWTGSVSEGIAIAFDGMKRATVIGTSMAALNGAIDGFELPHTKIGCNIAVERLYHIDGRPREDYRPKIEIEVTAQQPERDLILESALKQLK